MKPAPLLAFATGLAIPATGLSQSWVELRTFADFAAGSFPDGGTNLYIPKSGGMQSFHRWDFNHDGQLDIVMTNYHAYPTRSVPAFISWGGAQGYSLDRRQQFPTFGSHFGVRRDIGNIYDRRLEEEYVSAALEIPPGNTPSQISWKARTPNGTGIRFHLRSAATKQELGNASWQAPHDQPGAIQILAGRGWLQYRAVFTTPDGGSTAVLDEERIQAR